MSLGRSLVISLLKLVREERDRELHRLERNLPSRFDPRYLALLREALVAELTDES